MVYTYTSNTHIHTYTHTQTHTHTQRERERERERRFSAAVRSKFFSWLPEVDKPPGPDHRNQKVTCSNHRATSRIFWER